MTPLSPDLAAMFVLLLAMSAFTLATGVYLLVTNPPADEAKFVGLFDEKLADEEVDARHAAEE